VITLYQTCYACPEQYAAFFEGEQVGHLRLRSGDFTVRCPDHHGMLMFKAHPKGDGVFDDSERDHYLRRAIVSIVIWQCQGTDPWKMPYRVVDSRPPNESDDA
jgi:hypothetical protein